MPIKTKITETGIACAAEFRCKLTQVPSECDSIGLFTGRFPPLWSSVDWHCHRDNPMGLSRRTCPADPKPLIPEQILCASFCLLRTHEGDFPNSVTIATV